MDLPPKPNRPPSVASEEEYEIPIDDDESYYEVNQPLYRHSFSIIPVIFKMLISALVLLGLFFFAVSTASVEVWGFFVLCCAVGLTYYYYLALRWNGEEFVVNEEWVERPLSMPFPFDSNTPSIKRAKIAKSNLKRTFIDKLIGTCRLYSNTDVDDDKEFHSVKWLTHPAELRRALGISAPKKNNFGFLFRRRQ